MGFHDSLEAGSQIDSYRIEAPVARSGMASIYRATTCATTASLPSRFPIPTWKPIPSSSTAFSARPASAKSSTTPR
jgi:hypothetical protein